MGAETDKLDDALFFIPPNQQRVTFDMAFHIAAIIAGQNMWSVFSWNRQSIHQQSENILQFVNYICLVFITLKVLLKLRREFEGIHKESTKLRKLFRSSVSRLFEVSASFIAARVVLLGRSATNAISTLSTRLLRLRL